MSSYYLGSPIGSNVEVSSSLYLLCRIIASRGFVSSLVMKALSEIKLPVSLGDWIEIPLAERDIGWRESRGFD